MSRPGELDDTVVSDSEAARTASAQDADARTASAGAESAKGADVDALPATISRFTIKSKLGAGGHGMVLLATDPMLGRSVALKVLREAARPDAERRRRFLREAQTMAKLVHENIIVVHEVGTHEGRDYVAMEYIAGSTLLAWQAKRPWREIVEVYARAGRGLAFAHDEGFVHRDFKPENVLVGTDGRVRVTDFGLAAMVETLPMATTEPGAHPLELGASLTHTGAVMGTPRYMAPEQHLAEAVDARADQFSFCAALYEALYGRPAFVGASYAQLADAVIHQRPAPPPRSDVPAVLQRAILRGLSRYPADRFASMHELLAVLRDGSQVRPRSKRRMIGIAIAVIVVIGAAVEIWDDDEPPGKSAERAPTPAKPRSKLEQHAQIEFDDAEAHYQHAEYEEAAKGFMAAYEYQHLPELLYDAAAAHHTLGRQEDDVSELRQGMTLYRRYIQEAPHASDREKVQHAIKAIEELIATLEPDEE